MLYTNVNEALKVCLTEKKNQNFRSSQFKKAEDTRQIQNPQSKGCQHNHGNNKPLHPQSKGYQNNHGNNKPLQSRYLIRIAEYKIII